MQAPQMAHQPPPKPQALTASTPPQPQPGKGWQGPIGTQQMARQAIIAAKEGPLKVASYHPFEPRFQKFAANFKEDVKPVLWLCSALKLATKEELRPIFTDFG